MPKISKKVKLKNFKPPVCEIPEGFSKHLPKLKTSGNIYHYMMSHPGLAHTNIKTLVRAYKNTGWSPNTMVKKLGSGPINQSELKKWCKAHPKPGPKGKNYYFRPITRAQKMKYRAKHPVRTTRYVAARAQNKIANMNNKINEIFEAVLKKMPRTRRDPYHRRYDPRNLC